MRMSSPAAAAAPRAATAATGDPPPPRRQPASGERRRAGGRRARRARRVWPPRAAGPPAPARPRRAPRPAPPGGAWGARQADPPLAGLELGDGGEERSVAEVGPEHVGEDELGVGALPEEEVRDPALAARAHEQVELGQPLRPQPRL